MVLSFIFYCKKWSGKRGSNSRPRPWQGRALPTELFPHLSYFKMVPEARLELARPERRGILNPLRLPIPPLGHILKWSGKRGSNSRPRPWQGRALPTELFPRLLVAKQRGVFFYGFISWCQIKFVKKFFDWLKIIQK